MILIERKCNEGCSSEMDETLYPRRGDCYTAVTAYNRTNLEAIYGGYSLIRWIVALGPMSMLFL
jgi:hypothetical protein